MAFAIAMSKLHPHRGLVAAVALLAFTAGVLLGDRLPGEPTGFVSGLLVLLLFTWFGGRMHEHLRRGGTLDLLDELAAGCKHDPKCDDVRGSR